MNSTRRFFTLTLGHSVNALMVYGFDYVLYPFVIWKLGLLHGGVLMSFASLLVCLLTLWFYDWSKRDWLGIEAVKELRDIEPSGSIFRRVLAWAIQKGDVAACVALSIYTDPFITTTYMRRSAYGGMKKRDWHIFFGSWLISNCWWTIACFGGVLGRVDIHLSHK